MKGAANACGDMCLSGGPGHSSITTHSKQFTHGIINTMWWCVEKIFSWFWTVPHTVQYLSHLYSAQVVMIRFMTQLYCLQCVQYFWRFWWDIGHIYVLFCNWTISLWRASDPDPSMDSQLDSKIFSTVIHYYYIDSSEALTLPTIFTEVNL